MKFTINEPWVFVPSVARIALNNAARSFAYFVVIQNQFIANLVQNLVVGFIVVVLYYRKELKAIEGFLLEQGATEAKVEVTALNKASYL